MTSVPSDAEGAFASQYKPADIGAEQAQQQPFHDVNQVPTQPPAVPGGIANDPRFTSPMPPASSTYPWVMPTPPPVPPGSPPVLITPPLIPAAVELDTGTDELPEIRVTDPFPSQLEDMYAALRKAHDSAHLPQIYNRGGLPAIMSGGQIMEIRSAEIMKANLGKVANFVKREGGGENGHDVSVDARVDICKAVIADPSPLPELKGITNMPIIHADSSLHQTRGYDTQSGMYYVPSGKQVISVPEQPTADEVKKAVEDIKAPFSGFDFQTVADWVIYLALLLTLVVRSLITGNVPLFVIDSPIQGSGKSKLAYCANIIATNGQEGPMTMPERGFDEEIRKRLTALLISNPLLGMIDNVIGKVNWAPLASILTTGKWTDRLLQTSRTVTLAVKTVFLCTGVNVEIAGDMARRSVYIRLDPCVDKPWNRTFDFDPEQMVRERRSNLLEALFTLVRYWFNQGQPKWSGTPFGSFDDWAGIVGGILQTAGIEGFLENRNAADMAANQETSELAAFYEAWFAAYKQRPRRSAEVVRELTRKDPMVKGLLDALPEDMLHIVDLHEGRAAQKFGQALGKRKNRTAGGYKLVASENGNKTMLWKVVPVAPEAGAPEQPGMSGDGLFDSTGK